MMVCKDDLKKREESLIEPERGDFIFLAISNSIGEGGRC